MISKSSLSKIKRFEKLIRVINNHNDQLSDDIPLECINDVKNIITSLDEYFAYELMDTENVSENEDIVLIGNIGNAGTFLLGKHYKNILSSRLPKWFIEESRSFYNNINTYPDSDFLSDHKISAIYNVSEGGLFRTLYQLGKDSNKGFHIDCHQIPLSQITIEFCEIFDLNPMELFSCGCTLIVTPHGNKLMRAMKEISTIPCSVIGYITSNKDKLLFHNGTKSQINHPDPDALLNLLIS